MGTRGTAGRAVQAIRRRSVSADKLAYLFSVHRATGRDPVLVYSMSKVGSTTLARSVRTLANRSTLQVHELTRAGIQRSKQWWSENADDHRMCSLWRADYTRHRIRFDRRGGPWLVLNGVREPVARSVSMLFQLGERAGYFTTDTPAPEVDLDRLLTIYLELAPDESDWFRTEFEPMTGIDVYGEPFDPAHGYRTYRTRRFRHLLVRQEDLHRVGPTALAAFLGVEPSELPVANDGEAKPYADLYRRFAREVRIPEEVVEAAYASSLASHFYSAAELDGFRARWLG